MAWPSLPLAGLRWMAFCWTLGGMEDGFIGHE
jgi:hypothetical protein